MQQQTNSRKRKQTLLTDQLQKKLKTGDGSTETPTQTIKDQIAMSGDKPNLVYVPDYFSETEQQELISHLDQLDWQRVSYNKYGKTVQTPRRTFCYGQLGDTQEIVKWKGKSYKTEPFPDWLQQLTDRIQNESGLSFNACILNCYEDGSDSITMHVDAERFLAHANVASISLGQSRVFKYRIDGKINSVSLQSGSLSILVNGLEHAVPKYRNQTLSKRYNITLRQVKGNEGLGNYYCYNRGEKYQLQ